MNTRRAFTLIELLVVIAIIAILAAILFPVFAQAKVAAKKASDLSNQKQMGTAFHIYMADYDDLFPIAEPSSATTWFAGSYIDTPADWDTTVSATYHNARFHAWANSIQPYVKNTQITSSPGATNYSIPGWVYGGANANRPKHNANYVFNGLLTSWPQAAVERPSQLRLMTSVYGARNYVGAALSAPSLACINPQGCRYVPPSPTCDNGSPQGHWSYIRRSTTSTMWMFGQGVNAVMSDTSAKFQKVAGGPTTASDYRRDFWARYNAGGVPQWVEWDDQYLCHTLLFMPDFDFENFGTPVQF